MTAQRVWDGATISGLVPADNTNSIGSGYPLKKCDVPQTEAFAGLLIIACENNNVALRRVVDAAILPQIDEGL